MSILVGRTFRIFEKKWKRVQNTRYSHQSARIHRFTPKTLSKYKKKTLKNFENLQKIIKNQTRHACRQTHSRVVLYGGVENCRSRWAPPTKPQNLLPESIHHSNSWVIYTGLECVGKSRSQCSRSQCSKTDYQSSLFSCRSHCLKKVKSWERVNASYHLEYGSMCRTYI